MIDPTDAGGGSASGPHASRETRDIHSLDIPLPSGTVLPNPVPTLISTADRVP